MLGKMTQKAFISIYVLMILNLLFWMLTLIGGLVLGVGPALRTIYEMFLNHKFEYHNYHIREAWSLFKKYFVVGNIYFYTYFILSCFLFYDLYLTSQIKTIWMLPVVFLIVFLIIITLVAGLYSLMITSTFDINFKNTIKLSFVGFFYSFKSLLKLLFGIIIILAITRAWPGFILFLSVASIVVWVNFIGQEWMRDVISRLGE